MGDISRRSGVLSIIIYKEYGAMILVILEASTVEMGQQPRLLSPTSWKRL